MSSAMSVKKRERDGDDDGRSNKIRGEPVQDINAITGSMDDYKHIV